MKNCKHASCGEVCKYPPKEKKRYYIPRVSKKRAEENKIYFPLSAEFRKKFRYCAIKSPVCTKFTQGVHHKKGRIGELLTDVKFFKPACNACNQYCESHHEWAVKNGHKIAKNKI